MLDILQMNHTVQCTYAYLLCKYIVSLYLITYQQAGFFLKNFFFMEAWDANIILQVRIMQWLHTANKSAWVRGCLTTLAAFLISIILRSIN